jgi:hypothetical protein
MAEEQSPGGFKVGDWVRLPSGSKLEGESVAEVVELGGTTRVAQVGVRARSGTTWWYYENDLEHATAPLKVGDWVVLPDKTYIVEVVELGGTERVGQVRVRTHTGENSWYTTHQVKRATSFDGSLKVGDKVVLTKAAALHVKGGPLRVGDVGEVCGIRTVACADVRANGATWFYEMSALQRAPVATAAPKVAQRDWTATNRPTMMVVVSAATLLAGMSLLSLPAPAATVKIEDAVIAAAHITHAKVESVACDDAAAVLRVHTLQGPPAEVRFPTEAAARAALSTLNREMQPAGLTFMSAVLVSAWIVFATIAVVMCD